MTASAGRNVERAPVEKKVTCNHVRKTALQSKAEMAASIILPTLILIVHNFKEIDLAIFPVF